MRLCLTYFVLGLFINIPLSFSRGAISNLQLHWWLVTCRILQITISPHDGTKAIQHTDFKFKCHTRSQQAALLINVSRQRRCTKLNRSFILKQNRSHSFKIPFLPFHPFHPFLPFLPFLPFQPYQPSHPLASQQ